MRLDADLLYESLPEELNATIAGPRRSGLSIGRPLLYEGPTQQFESGGLYLCYANRLPRRPHLVSGCVIVAIGESRALDAYRRQCSVITLPDESDFFHTFNVLQDIYDRFDEWERKIGEAALLGDIQGMLDSSLSVLGNPIYCLDANFQVLAVTLPEDYKDPQLGGAPSSGNPLQLSAIDQFLDNHELSMSSREPMVISLLDQTTLNYNLYDENVFEGCLTVHYTQSPYSQSDRQIVEFIGNAIVKALGHVSISSTDSRGSIERVIRDLIEDKPLDATERAMLADSECIDPHVCVRLKPCDETARLPLGYIRAMLESSFPSCIAFEYHHNSIVALIPSGQEGDSVDLHDDCVTLSKRLGVKMGVSDAFESLAECRLRLTQADRALDKGIATKSTESVFEFNDVALSEMIEGATSELPLELLSPVGLLKLAKHDRESSASYVETLRIYLENNANTTRTARDLFIHRSTLMERLERIRRVLNVDLDDPDMQLRLRMLLKAMEMRAGTSE